MSDEECEELCNLTCQMVAHKTPSGKVSLETVGEKG